MSRRAASASTLPASQRHHPSSASVVPLDHLRDRVADSLGLCGFRWAEVAAGVLEARGRSGLDCVEFARRAGIDVDLLRRAEAGELPRDELPRCLRRMVPR